MKTAKASDPIELLSGGLLFKDGASQDQVVSGDNSTISAATPQDEGKKLPRGSNQLAWSPNGELVTFREPDTQTALVADSGNLTRRSDTFVHVDDPYECRWVSGNELWYKSTLDGEPDEIIIELGLKEKGLRPKEFPDKNAGSLGEDGSSYLIAGADPTAEIVPIGINSSGVLAGILKEGEFEGFIMDSNDSGTAGIFGPKDSKGNDLSLTPRDINDQGMVAGYVNMQGPKGDATGLFVYKPGSGFYVAPLMAGDQYKGFDKYGHVLIDSMLWDPFVKDRVYPKQDPPGSGLMKDIENLPAGAVPLQLYPGGMLLSAKKEGSSMSVYIGMVNQVPTEIMKAKLAKFSQDPKRPQDFSVTFAAPFGSMSTPLVDACACDTLGRFYYREGDVIYRAKSGADREQIFNVPAGLSLFFRGVTDSGIVFGDTPAGGVFIYKGEIHYLAKMLGPGYACDMLRHINENGDISASLRYNGVPIGLIPNVFELLKK